MSNIRFILLAFVSLVVVSPADAEVMPPFRVRYQLPADGLSAVVIDSTQGTRIRNIEAEIERKKGPSVIAWDLKDDLGNYVSPGSYKLRSLVMPPVELHYQHTPYPNIENYSTDRVPWYTSQSGPHGWLSDCNNNSVCATSGDQVYFGSWSSEAGQAFIECTLDGKRQWGYHWFGPWLGAQGMAADEQAVYIASHNRMFRFDKRTKQMREVFTYFTDERRGWPNALAARDGKLFVAFAPLGGAELFDDVTTENMVDHDNSLPVYPTDAQGDRLKPNPRNYFLRLLRLT
ncbi:MAG TPA: hypothetical protein VM141_13305 [Planctomycetota bacterium]|nr:hypothetical protein [Planctomycetota bacterium]